MDLTAQWSSDDVANWAAFLRTQTGSRLIPKILEVAPALMDGADVNKTLVRNGERRGFEQAIERMIQITSVEKSAADVRSPATAYPPLEDDTAWPETEPLNPETPGK